MNVLLLMITYPDVDEHSNLYSDLAMEFHRQGHSVFVVAANGPKPSAFREEAGITVMRTRTMELFDTTMIRKGISNVLLPYQFSRAIRRYYSSPRFDLVISPTPPITFINTLRFIKRRDGASVYLVLRDIFPQNARDLGLIRNSLLFAYFRRKEKRLYRTVDFIGCMSHGNVDYVHEHNPTVAPDKIGLLPNWLRTVSIAETRGNLRREFGLEGKFIALFGGSIGKPQKIELILDLAAACEGYDDVVFLIIGKGTEKRKIEGLIETGHLRNVMLKDFIPSQSYLELIRQCDLGIVTLSDRFTIPNIPSRTLGYWNARLPVLAAVDTHTDFGALLEEAGGGLWSVAGDIEAFKRNFDSLYRDPELRRNMGLRGYEYLSSHLTAESSYQRIMGHLE